MKRSVIPAKAGIQECRIVDSHFRGNDGPAGIFRGRISAPGWVKGRDVALVPVQHHHAHMASCMAENGLTGPVIGATFDGTGYGADGAIWGGEILVGDFRSFQRWAHLKYVRQPGGEIAIKRPYRMALSYVLDSFGDIRAFAPLAERLEATEVELVRRQVEKGLNSPLTSSCGRLFDAVSSLLGLRDVVTFEGQAAIELEMIADKTAADWYPLTRPEQPSPRVVDTLPLIRAIVGDLRAGVPREAIAAKFHTSLARVVGEICQGIRREQQISTVVLSGGVFQNQFLLQRTIKILRSLDFAVYTHHLVPCNDGGISLGQAVIANARSAIIGAPRG